MVSIQRLSETVDASRFGGKARYLGWLIEQGERVPLTWAIPAGIDGSDLPRTIAVLDPDAHYAVRCSANVGDGQAISHAGQFLTELDVPADEVAAAVSRVQESAFADRIAAYPTYGGPRDPIAVGVLVQVMVDSVSSGVVFSRNPMTGLNEIVVEAIAGRGDRLGGDGVTPQRWVWRWGTWMQQPENALLPETVAQEIVETATRLAKEFGEPVDLEWAWDGDELWWVQLQPITGLDRIPVYSNRISREVLPGMIKPLVWSVNVPMVNQAWVDLFTEAIGPNEIRADDLAKSFCYRAYFNMAAIGDVFRAMGMPRDSLELLLGLPAGENQPSFKPTPQTMRLLPRMTAVAVRKARYGRLVAGEVESLRQAYLSFADRELDLRSDSALLSDIRALIDIGVRAAYANIVTPLLANVHNSLLRRSLSRAGLDPELVEFGGTEDLAEVNPNAHLHELAEEVRGLDDEARSEIRSEGFSALPDDVRAKFADFLDRFGHLSASGNDFSVPPWSETPDAVVAMALDFASVRGDTGRQTWTEVEEDLSPLRRLLLRALRDRTESFIAHRENVSFTYTYGYGLFRRYFLEAGRRLVERGILDDEEDVMFLYLDELKAALLGLPVDPPAQLVATRRREMEMLAEVAMPDVIYGDDFVPTPGAFPVNERAGIPTSRGHYRGTLRVVRDTGDFARVAPGEVIAIPFSDVGWTPLFARAGAVVAEAGGMLSHSSIVAREYGIPCVVSVPGATQLPDGATVVVDGYLGTVVVEDGDSQ